MPTRSSAFRLIGSVVILNDPFFKCAAASEGSMLFSTVQTRGWFASDEDATGVSFTAETVEPSYPKFGS
jgi:hypothetical protein